MASPKGTPTLPSRRPRTHIPPHTRRTSQSATPATQNDLTTSSDTSRKTCFCGLLQRHANFTLTTVAHTHSSSHTSNVTECHACHANDLTTSSDTSRKTRFCGFPHRHGNFTFTTVARGRLRTPKAGSREHVSTPRPPKCKTRTLRHAFGNQERHADEFRTALFGNPTGEAEQSPASLQLPLQNSCL